MKHPSILTCLVFTILLSSESQAQAPSPISKLYLSTSMVGVPQKGEDAYGSSISLNMVVRKKWAFSLSYHDAHINPSNLPKDFDAGHSEGLILFLPFSGPDVNPMVHCQMVSFNAGRNFLVGKKSWFQLKGGPSLVMGEKTKFSRQAVTNESGYFIFGYSETRTSNYSMTKTNQTSPGLMVQGDIHQPISRHLALGFGITSEISSVQSMVLFEFKLIAGHLGIEKKSKHHNKTN